MFKVSITVLMAGKEKTIEAGNRKRSGELTLNLEIAIDNFGL
jgi:hypothetical protein